MGLVRFHVAHADGREWTLAELDALVARDFLGREDRVPGWWFNVVDEDGRPLVVDGTLGAHGVMDGDDMVVVWDG